MDTTTAERVLVKEKSSKEKTPREMIEEKQRENPQMPKGLILSIAAKESGGATDPRYVINGKAVGFLQQMPIFTKQYKVKDTTNPEQAIKGTVDALNHAYRVFGTWDKAVAAYTAGIKNVNKKGLDGLHPVEQKYYKDVLLRLHNPSAVEPPGKAFLKFLDTPVSSVQPVQPVSAKKKEKGK